MEKKLNFFWKMALVMLHCLTSQKDSWTVQKYELFKKILITLIYSVEMQKIYHLKIMHLISELFLWHYITFPAMKKQLKRYSESHMTSFSLIS